MRWVLTPFVVVSGLLALTLALASTGAQPFIYPLFPRPEPPPVRVLGYDLTLTVEPSSRRIEGRAKIELEALQGDVRSVRFALNKALALKKVELGERVPRCTEGAPIAEGRALDLSFEPPLRKGARCEVVFEYAGQGADPDDKGPDWMGVLLVRNDEIRMSHQSQWYPVVPCDDRALAKLTAPIELALRVPAGLESLGPGVLIGKDKKDNDGFEVHRWRCNTPARASILAGAYRALAVEDGGVRVRVLAFEEHVDGAQRWGTLAASTLRSIHDLLGGIERDSYGIGAMRVRNRSRSYNYEADGFSVYDAVLFRREPDARKLAHEIAHLWFGGAVSPLGNGERFLTESFAELTAWLQLEKAQGAEAAAKAARAAASDYFAKLALEPALADAGFRDQRYREVVYLKGPLALRTLRAWLGEDAFLRGLRAYVERFAGKAEHPDLDAFLDAMRAHGKEIVDAWAEEWLRRPGAAVYSVEWTTQGARLRGKLLQPGLVFTNPVELDVELEDGTTQRLSVTPRSAAHAFEEKVRGAVRAVKIDPQQLVLWKQV